MEELASNSIVKLIFLEQTRLAMLFCFVYTALCGMWDFSSPTRDLLQPLQWKAQSLNHDSGSPKIANASGREHHPHQPDLGVIPNLHAC